MPSDSQLMQRALMLARKGVGWTSPNPAVGAVIVRRRKVLGEGYHHRAGAPHAEIEALRDARRRGHDVRGATMVVTLEPCCHHGRTPPCTEALLKAGLARVVIAMRDPNPKVAGKGLRQLKKAGVRVTLGTLEKQAQALNEIFSHWIATRRPYVALKMSISLDGKISPSRKERGKVFYLIGKPALKRVHQMRQQFDGICVGIRTILQDNPQLTTRLPGKGPWKHPRPVVLDSNARTPLHANILKRLKHRKPAIIVVGPRAPKARIAALKRKGADVIQVRLTKSGLDLRQMLRELGKRQVTSLMVEGGAQVATSFLSQKLLDRADFVVAPIILPGGVPMLRMTGKVMPKLRSSSTERVGRDLWVRGVPSAPAN